MRVCARRTRRARQVVEVVLGGSCQHVGGAHIEGIYDPLPLYCRDVVECRVMTSDGARAMDVHWIVM